MSFGLFLVVVVVVVIAVVVLDVVIVVVVDASFTNVYVILVKNKTKQNKTLLPFVHRGMRCIFGRPPGNLLFCFVA